MTSWTWYNNDGRCIVVPWSTIAGARRFESPEAALRDAFDGHGSDEWFRAEAEAAELKARRAK